MKYISVFVCLALIIVSICFLPPSAGNDVTVGMGDGINKELETPQDIQGLLKYISEENSAELYNQDSFGISVLNYNDGKTPTDVAAKKTTKKQTYKSVTIHENAYMTVSSKSSYGSSKTTVNRKLSIYITKDATYYHSIGQQSSTYSYSSSEVSNNSNSSSFASFDIEVFIDSNNSDAYVKFNRWNMTSTSETVIISTEILGRWVKFNGKSFDALYAVDNLNKDSLATIGEIINTAIDEDLFDTNNNTYSLSKKDIEKILGADGIKQGEFTVDLSTPARPLVKLLVSASESNKQSNVYANAYTKTEYIFENINNTVVEMDENADILVIDEDEVDDYIIVED